MIRTDVEYRDGKLSVREDQRSDARKPLPKVEPTDRLGSDKWGESIQREAGMPDSTIDAIASTHKAIVSTYRNLVEVRDNQSPELTQAAHLNNVARSVESSLDGFAGKTRTVKAAIDDRLKSIDKEAKETMNFRQRGNASELRAILRSMSEKDRNTAIDAATKSGDGELLAAVFDGVHPLQVGMNGEQHRGRYNQALNHHAPQLLKLSRALESGRELLTETFSDYLMQSDVISAKALRKQYDKQAEAARAASKRAEQTMM